jgi:hypothetical protein
VSVRRHRLRRRGHADHTHRPLPGWARLP